MVCARKELEQKRMCDTLCMHPCTFTSRYYLNTPRIHHHCDTSWCMSRFRWYGKIQNKKQQVIAALASTSTSVWTASGMHGRVCDIIEAPGRAGFQVTPATLRCQFLDVFGTGDGRRWLALGFSWNNALHLPQTCVICGHTVTTGAVGIQPLCWRCQ